ncbi:hypothetical protein Tel_07955 [Candidatus Tenderia electrophaga]|jgi:hypothetical protein|uniref:DUF3592 domain-containing protein n=1 Tax=Candidatus Tenderia electrophaga TaxID=1748243 RepID=A0A0S2TD68_9GAMM|nr:hypothetical protein Tel_07955 [Candidatus Tenderia electrophaga]
MNLYGIILVAVALGGIAVSLWGWRVLKQARQMAQWPSTDGVIVESKPCSAQDDLLPHIEYRYEIGGETHRRRFEFPSGTNPMPELAESYVKKYPLDAPVQVFYNPDEPGQSTLEPGSRGDWMILVLGILMTVGALVSLLVSL